MSKIFVSVLAEITINGEIIPRNIIWDDGRKFNIDKIMDIRRAASLKSGGCGIRYFIKVGGKERYLFFDDGKWFIEI